jgi:hypothetical protein
MDLIMKNLLSIKLNGDVTLADFTEVMNHFSTLIEELTSDVGEKAQIDWEIIKLESGSATAVVMGKSQNEFAVDKVVHAYEVIAKSITESKPIPYSETIAREARSITNVINGKIKSIEMNTKDYNITIDCSIQDVTDEKIGYSIGTVTGWVETLSKHGKMRFILYDILFDRAVTCYLAKNQEGLMLDAWDKKITVAGKVFRESATGRPYQVKDINYIEEKKTSPKGSFIRAQGIIPWQDGDEYPEDTIRRYRDAQE